MICVHGRVPTHNELVAFLLQRYKEDYGKIKIPNYLEVFRNSTREELTKENQENMVIFLFAYNVEDENKYHIFDFNIEKVMVGSGAESHVYEENIVGEANENIKKQLLGLFEKYDVYSWKVKEYYDTEDSAYWNIAIKYNNGHSYGLSGELINGEESPEDLDLFVNDLKALATSSSEE